MIEQSFINSLDEDLRESNQYLSLKDYANTQIPITQLQKDNLFNTVCFQIGAKTKEKEDFVREYIKEDLDKIVVMTQDEIDELKKKEKDNQSPKKLTAPNLWEGRIVAIVVMAFSFILNDFWIIWIATIAVYLYWKQKQIEKFNPLDFPDIERKDTK